ncbi:MAG: aminopeptidase [Ruminococcaceae bacterium]|nr:aminopeptidase [Oscillospiraceae bacterium]
MCDKETSKTKELKDKLLIGNKYGIKKLSQEEIAKADAWCEDYKIFLDNSKTERDAVEYSIALLEKNGFTEYQWGKKYNAGDKVYYNNRGKALVAAVMGKKGVSEGTRLAIAHIDSPRIDLKPNPLYEANDLALFKTHYYGGIRKYQWLAMPLALHGVVSLVDGTNVKVIFGEDENEPVLCISDLLPHLAYEQVTKPLNKAFDGEDLNVLVGSRPYSDEDEGELVKLNVMSILNEKYGITEQDFLSAELCLVPTYKTRDVGFDKSLLGGYGHDDKCCAYPAVMAAIDAKETEYTAITVLCDKEETGSDGNTGMQSDFLRYFIMDLAKSEGVADYQAISRSKCLSADVNAAFDPTYASAFEGRNSSYLNRGVVISKYTGHGGKGGTSDASAEYMGEVRRMLEKNDIIWQVGELGRVDLGGGGTIAKYIANMNVDTVDLGVPVLSMHAPFEIISKIDIYMAYRAFFSFFE